MRAIDNVLRGGTGRESGGTGAHSFQQRRNWHEWNSCPSRLIFCCDHFHFGKDIFELVDVLLIPPIAGSTE
jgi:hypothetical protein